MAKRNDGLLELLVELPWWVSITVGTVVYVGLRFVIPAITFENQIFKALAPVAPAVAWMAVLFLLPAVFSFFNTKRKRRLLDSQENLNSIRSLSWREFEELLGEAYRRQGYIVQENSGAGPDGGIDLIIGKGRSTFLVQCKQWKATKVNVSVVREMFGLMVAHQASGVIIVSSGMFTQEAKNFAEGKPIDLVDGEQLIGLIGSVQSSLQKSSRQIPLDTVRRCPQCSSELVIREARRGKNVGNKFWGCASYPKCRFIEDFTEE